MKCVSEAKLFMNEMCLWSKSVLSEMCLWSKSVLSQMCLWTKPVCISKSLTPIYKLCAFWRSKQNRPSWHHQWCHHELSWTIMNCYCCYGYQIVTMVALVTRLFIFECDYYQMIILLLKMAKKVQFKMKNGCPLHMSSTQGRPSCIL